jgi:hypothetical protein
MIQQALALWPARIFNAGVWQNIFQNGCEHAASWGRLVFNVNVLNVKT